MSETPPKYRIESVDGPLNYVSVGFESIDLAHSSRIFRTTVEELVRDDDNTHVLEAQRRALQKALVQIEAILNDANATVSYPTKEG